jgi:hypothetical protein
LTATYRLDSDFVGLAFGGFQFEPKEKLTIQRKAVDWKLLWDQYNIQDENSRLVREQL